MKKVYSVAPDGRTTPFDYIHCANEEEELQNLLEKNLDLIPGDQVDPDDPRRWLLVKREMVVEDPGTGEGRWSLDMLMVDQDGIPTLVECKRFKDTRARREVIGQMFDYAANASFYLSKDTVTQYLEEQAQNRGVDIEAYILGIQPSSGASLEGFLGLIDNNITQGQIRLVFFMEESPPELRSIVTFLNSQMEQTEVCLVEARQFKQNGLRVVVPTLYGYTDKARRIKKTVTVTKSAKGRLWNLDAFKADTESRLDSKSATALLGFYNFCRDLPKAQIRWGAGPKRGSFSIAFPPAIDRSILTSLSDGELWLNFIYLNHTETENAVRSSLFNHLSKISGLGLTASDQTKQPGMKAVRWLPFQRHVEKAIQSALQENQLWSGRDDSSTA